MPPPAGSYSSGGGSYSMFVSADSKKIQGVDLNYVELDCTPGGGTVEDRVPIASDGSFKKTWTQQGAVAGKPATFTRTFQGHFHGIDSSGRARLAGQIIDQVTYDNGGTVTCSVNEPWLMRRDS